MNYNCQLRYWRYSINALGLIWNPVSWPQVRLCISKKWFCLGGIAPSELTQSIRAVRGILVVAASAPGVKTMHRVAFRDAIAVSPVLLALSVSYFKRILWHARPTVTISRNGCTGHALASVLECDGWCCENLSSCSFYLHGKCNSLFTNYTHYWRSPDLCGYWQSIARSVHLLSYFW